MMILIIYCESEWIKYYRPKCEGTYFANENFFRSLFQLINLVFCINPDIFKLFTLNLNTITIMYSWILMN